MTIHSVHPDPTQGPPDQFDLLPEAMRRFILAALAPFVRLQDSLKDSKDESKTAPFQRSISTSALGWRAGDAEAMRIDEDVWLYGVAASLEEGGPMRVSGLPLGLAIIKDRTNRIRDVHLFAWVTYDCDPSDGELLNLAALQIPGAAPMAPNRQVEIH